MELSRYFNKVRAIALGLAVHFVKGYKSGDLSLSKLGMVK